MKRRYKIVILVFIMLIIFYCFLLQKHREIVNSWDCTVTYAEGASNDTYVITYCDEKIISTTGILTLENGNDFGIIVYLKSDGYERIESVDAGSKMVLYNLDKEAEYTVGFHSSVIKGSSASKNSRFARSFTAALCLLSSLFTFLIKISAIWPPA